MRLQVTQYDGDPRTVWQLCKDETSLYWDVLERWHPDEITDIGCGLGRVSVFLNQHWSASFLLLDSSGCHDAFAADSLIGGWHGDAHVWHNDIAATSAFCNANGLNAQVMDMGRAFPVPPIKRRESCRMAISMLAMGFHFSADAYLDWLRTCDVIVLGIRRGLYTLDNLRELESLEMPYTSIRRSCRLKYDVLVLNR
jgi:hypothetical protein